MKSKTKFSLTFPGKILGLVILSLLACKKLDPNIIGTKGSPSILSVHTISKGFVDSTAKTSLTTYDTTGKATTTTNPNYGTMVKAFDSITATGKGGTLYQIVGTHLGSATSITFNGVTAYFNPAYLTDNSIIVAVPSTAPFGSNQSASLMVKTLYGTATFKFSIIQPAPIISGFNPVSGSPNDTITITGAILDNASAVKFGTIPATIVSNTTNQIKVLLPPGVVQSLISVTTAGGTTISTASFGYAYIVYGEGLTTGWGGNGGGYSGYNSTLDFNNTDQPHSGKKDIKVTFLNAYGALQIGYGGSTSLNVSTLGLKAIKFYVYPADGIKAGDRLQVVINGNYNGTTVTMTPGAYQSFTIPLSTLGNPATINEIVLQNQGSAVNSVIYIDDLGFL